MVLNITVTSLIFWCILAINTVSGSTSSAETRSSDGNKFDRLQSQIRLLESVIGELVELCGDKATNDDIEDLQNQIEALNPMNADSISALRMDVEAASIIPPSVALNMAICIGQLAGLSGMEGSSSVDLRCPPGSTPSTNGFNDRSGMGIERRTDVATIEDCRDICLARDACNSFNWSPTNGNTDDCAGTTCCTIYGAAEASRQVDYSVVYCGLNDEPIDEPCIIGEIISYAGASEDLPDGFVLANGDTINRNDYPTVCDILGDLYGTGGMDECVLPNLEDKFIYGATDDTNVGECTGDDTINL